MVSGEKGRRAAEQPGEVDFIVKKVSAIVLSPCDSKAIGPVIREANDGVGIPVLHGGYSVSAEKMRRSSTQIATDNFGGGKEAAKAMIEALGEQGGKVAILHFKQAESCLAAGCLILRSDRRLQCQGGGED